MGKSRLPGAVSACAGVLLFTTNIASAAIIALHSGDTDPLTEGWTIPNSSNVVTVGAVNDSGTLAWTVDDNSTANLSFENYLQTPTAQQTLDGDTNGWTLSVNLRVVDNPDALDASIFAEYNSGTTRYALVFGSQSDGDPIVGLFSDTGNVTYALEGVGNTYNFYELIYDPLAGSADLFVNGIEQLSNYAGFSAGAVDPRIIWGSAQSTSTGQGNYNLVQFEITAVPIPASVWLFGSGLLGLVGIARRKKAV